jgi:hypothetical protein
MPSVEKISKGKGQRINQKAKGKTATHGPPTHDPTLIRLLVYLIFSTKDRADGIRPDVESQLINFWANMRWNTTSATSGGEGVCDPFRVVM